MVYKLVNLELHSVGAAAAKALLVVPQRGSLAPLQTSSWLSAVPSNGLGHSGSEQT